MYIFKNTLNSMIALLAIIPVILLLTFGSSMILHLSQLYLSQFPIIINTMSWIDFIMRLATVLCILIFIGLLTSNIVFQLRNDGSLGNFFRSIVTTLKLRRFTFLESEPHNNSNDNKDSSNQSIIKKLNRNRKYYYVEIVADTVSIYRKIPQNMQLVELFKKQEKTISDYICREFDDYHFSQFENEKYWQVMRGTLK